MSRLKKATSEWLAAIRAIGELTNEVSDEVMDAMRQATHHLHHLSIQELGPEYEESLDVYREHLWLLYEALCIGHPLEIWDDQDFNRFGDAEDELR